MRRLLVVVTAILCMAAAADPAERLANPDQEARARHIFSQVRCLVCQNESIDDSQADLAGDLRKLVRDQIVSGRSDDQVRDYLISRYGEFVLLKPAFSLGNLALWLSPVLVLLFGLSLMILRQRRGGVVAELSEEEAKRLAELAKDAGS